MVLMNAKDSFSATKQATQKMMECGNSRNERRKIKSMVVQTRHKMGNPVEMLKDYVLPLMP